MRFSKAICWAAAMTIAFSVVKLYWGGTCALAALRASAVRIVLSKSAARGATMSRVASWPSLTMSGGSDRRSAPRIAASARMRTPAAIARRGISWRVNRAEVSVRWVSMSAGFPLRSVAAVVRGEVGPGQRPGDERADDLAVGATTRARRQPAHHLAHVARRRRPGGVDRLVDERRDLGLGQGRRQIARDDLDLGLLARGEILATAGPEGLDGF